MAKILFVVNPVAFGGRGWHVWKKFRAQWPEQISPQDIVITEKPGQAREIAASCGNYEVITAIGGDGTANEVISGIMDRPEPARPALGVIAAGTGNDIAHLGGIRSVGDAVAALRANQARVFDLIRIDCQVNGQAAERHALLFGNAGFGAALLGMLKPWMKKFFGPQGAYFLASFLAALVYQAPTMTVHWPGGEYQGRTWMVLAGNSEYAGGGSMRICPGAQLDDGQLDIVIIPFRTKREIFFKLFKLANGSYINDRQVRYFPTAKIQVESFPPCGLGMDGDIFGYTPATFSVHPRAIKVISRLN